MKLANCLSILRMILSLCILFTQGLSLAFFIIYILCGLTDIFDGYIARKTNSTTILGAKLDSFADMLMFLSMLYVLLPFLGISYFIIIWIFIIAIIKFISILIGFKKFNKFSLVHTYLNKLTGTLLVILPFLLLLFYSNILLIILCLIATIASIEELAIILISKDLDLNCKYIFEIF